MKKEECTFSGDPIHPGRGKRYIAIAFLSTKPVLPFATRRTAQLFLRKKNPRYVPWTRTYRKVNRKGTAEETAKRRARKVRRVVQRGYFGMDHEAIQAKKVHAAKKTEKTAAGKAAKAEIADRKAKVAPKKAPAGKAAPPQAAAKAPAAKAPAAKAAKK